MLMKHQKDISALVQPITLGRERIASHRTGAHLFAVGASRACTVATQGCVDAKRACLASVGCAFAEPAHHDKNDLDPGCIFERQ